MYTKMRNPSEIEIHVSFEIQQLLKSEYWIKIIDLEPLSPVRTDLERPANGTLMIGMN